MGAEKFSKMKPMNSGSANVLPTRESVSQHQLISLLSIVETLKSYLISEPPASDSPHRLPPELDGGAHDAAATTLIKACGRIDDLIDDKSRWGLENHDALCKTITSLAGSQEKFLAEQTLSSQEIRRPSFQLRPTLFIVEGRFVAVHGDPMTPGAYIVGQGPTPEAALIDFDAAFLRTPPEQLRLLAEQTAAPAPAPTQPKRKKNK